MQMVSDIAFKKQCPHNESSTEFDEGLNTSTTEQCHPPNLKTGAQYSILNLGKQSS